MIRHEPILSLSKADTERFNLRIVRGRIERDSISGELLAQEIEDLRADIAVIRLPAGNVKPLYTLIDKGLTPIHADTLVYYIRDLANPVRARSREVAWKVELANVTDREAIANIARDAFSSYRSHYHANRRLSVALITEGYAEWAVSFLIQDWPCRETWVVRQKDKVLAFATCQLNLIQDDAEIVLNAVEPAHAGHGVYTHLLAEIMTAYRSRHFRFIRISTQIWNYRVQKAWTSAGFFLTHAYDTYHINVQRDASDHPVSAAR